MAGFDFKNIQISSGGGGEGASMGMPLVRNPAAGTGGAGDGAAHFGPAPVLDAAQKRLQEWHASQTKTEAPAQGKEWRGRDYGGKDKFVSNEFNSVEKDGIRTVFRNMVVECVDDAHQVEGLNDFETVAVRLWKIGMGIPEDQPLTRKIVQTDELKFNLSNFEPDQLAELDILLRVRAETLGVLTGLEENVAPLEEARLKSMMDKVQEGFKMIRHGQKDSDSRVDWEIEMNRMIGDTTEYKGWNVLKRMYRRFLVDGNVEAQNLVQKVIREEMHDRGYSSQSLDGASLKRFLLPDQRENLDKDYANTHNAAKLLTAHLKGVSAEGPDATRDILQVSSARQDLIKTGRYADTDSNPARKLQLTIDANLVALNKISAKDAAAAVAGHYNERELSKDAVNNFLAVSGHVKTEDDQGAAAKRQTAQEALDSAKQTLDKSKTTVKALEAQLLSLAGQITTKENQINSVAPNPVLDRDTRNRLDKDLDALREEQRSKTKTKTDIESRKITEQADFDTKEKALKKLGSEAKKGDKEANELMKALAGIVPENGSKNKLLSALIDNSHPLPRDEQGLFDTVRIWYGLTGENFKAAMGADNEYLKVFLVDAFRIDGIDIVALQKAADTKKADRTPKMNAVLTSVTDRIYEELKFAVETNRKDLMVGSAFKAWNALMVSSTEHVSDPKNAIRIDRVTDAGIRGVIPRNMEIGETGRPDVMTEVLERNGIHLGVDAVGQIMTLSDGKKIAITADPDTGMCIAINENGKILGNLERRVNIGQGRRRIEAVTTPELQLIRDEIYLKLGGPLFEAELNNILRQAGRNKLENYFTAGLGLGTVTIERTANGDLTINGEIWQQYLDDKPYKQALLDTWGRSAVERIEDASDALRYKQETVGEIEAIGNAWVGSRRVGMDVIGWEDKNALVDPAINPNARRIEIVLSGDTPQLMFEVVQPRVVRIPRPGLKSFINAAGNRVYYDWVLEPPNPAHPAGGLWNLDDVRPRFGNEPYPPGMDANKIAQSKQFFEAMYQDMLYAWENVEGYSDAFQNTRIAIGGDVLVFGRGKTGKFVATIDGEEVDAAQVFNNNFATGKWSMENVATVQRELGFFHARHAIVNYMKEATKPIIDLEPAIQKVAEALTDDEKSVLQPRII